MSLKAGWIYHVKYFDKVKPEHGKYAVCVCAAKNYFFLINTENRTIYDCIPIKAVQHPKLGQDRYVSCKIITTAGNAEIEPKYQISDIFLKELITKISDSKFLSQTDKNLMLLELSVS